MHLFFYIILDISNRYSTQVPVKYKLVFEIYIILKNKWNISECFYDSLWGFFDM